MIQLMKALHRRMPPRFKQMYMPVVTKNSYHVQRAVNLLYPPVFLFEGQAQGTQTPLCLAYAGFHAEAMHYWAGALLCPGFRTQALGRHWIWKVHPLLKQRSMSGLLLLEHNALTLTCLRRTAGFRVPFWVSMVLDISGPWEGLLGRQRLDIDRRIRKNGLSYVMTRDIARFDDFFHNMYRPYIQDRHTQTAFLETYDDVRRGLSKGELILIMKEGQSVAGGMVEFVDGQPRFRRLGVRDAKWEYVQYGVLGAIYYFLTLEMKKRGCSSMHIGGVRPLLNDGVTQFKRSLKARFVPDERRSCLWMTFVGNPGGLRDVLGNHPFIFINTKKQLCRSLFAEPPLRYSVPSDDEGLVGTYIILPGDGAPESKLPDGYRTGVI